MWQRRKLLAPHLECARIGEREVVGLLINEPFNEMEIIKITVTRALAETFVGTQLRQPAIKSAYKAFGN
jgi:hypothetical protein